MSTLKVLKGYLVDDGGYLINPDNNGKTVMLSGAWGSGKTYFWQKDIEPKLSEKLKDDNKACVYVSLYGKDSLEEIKQEVLFKASTEKDYLSDEIEAFGFNALSTIDEVGGAVAAIYKVASNINESRRDKKGTNKLKNGGIICFDDFERKSKKIDLNDLFGFISQLAISLNCKVVIILNSDVFKGEEANVFKTVKEKTVNKFFYFEPTIDELFTSIYSSNEKYKRLDDYKDDILNAIKETEELNARIYIQVLDNCLEWINKRHDIKVLRALVLNTVCFIRNHFLLEIFIFNTGYKTPLYSVMENYPTPIMDWFLYVFNINEESKAFYEVVENRDIVFELKQWISKKTHKGSFEYKESTHEQYLLWIDNHVNELKSLYKYGYLLYDFEPINDLVKLFIKSGILPKKEEK